MYKYRLQFGFLVWGMGFPQVSAEDIASAEAEASTRGGVLHIVEAQPHDWEELRASYPFSNRKVDGVEGLVLVGEYQVSFSGDYESARAEARRFRFPEERLILEPALDMLDPHGVRKLKLLVLPDLWKVWKETE